MFFKLTVTRECYYTSNDYQQLTEGVREEIGTFLGLLVNVPKASLSGLEGALLRW